MKTLVIATLIFLDLFPSGTPFIFSLKSDLEKKLVVDKVEVAQEVDAPEFSSLPNKGSNFALPPVDARAYLEVDMETSDIMLEKNKDEKLQVASLTKLMTARLLLKDGNLAKTIKVNDLSRMRAEDSRANLVLGDEIAYRDLLYALLINSASDSALTIANSLYPGGYNEFINKMNEEARALGMKNTNFDNPVGWDSPNNYSTANDLQVLARTLLKNAEFKKVVATSGTSFTSEGGYVYPLKNTNVLLDGTTFFGVKTGRTGLAGDCLIALAKVKNREVLYLVLGAGDRFFETRSLLNWTNLVYNW